MEMWDHFLNQMDLELGKETVNRWLRPFRLAHFDAANIYLEAVDSFQIAWFEEHIRSRVKHLVSPSGRRVRIHLSCPSQNHLVSRSPAQITFSVAPDPLDPEMTLEHFLAHKPSNGIGSKLVFEAEKCLFNPILFYGPPSSGKTHLLMSAAAHLQKKGLNAFYVKAETFTEHVVQAMRKGTMQDVRAAYRSVEALIIDDIHLFARKVATQEEFFHTFNELHIRRRPILLSSRLPPSRLQEIEPRLISRFEWGVSIGIEKEDEALILQEKGIIWKLSIEPELIPFLLQHFPSSPVLALQALALRAKEAPKLTCQLASLLLNDLLQKEAVSVWTPEKIVKEIASHFGIRTTDILGKSKTREAAIPRQIAMYLCREMLKLPFQKIGEIFGRDHSTVMSSVKQIQEGVASQKPELLDCLRAMAFLRY